MFSRRSVCLLMLVVLLNLGAAAPRQESLVRRLVQEDLFTWYQSQTDAELDPSYAGAYVMLAVGDELFLGLSASVPTHDHNGALFAAHDGASLRLIAPLDEQDVNRMRAVGDTIFIPGYDPNDGWDAGISIVTTRRPMLSPSCAIATASRTLSMRPRPMRTESILSAV